MQHIVAIIIKNATFSCVKKEVNMSDYRTVLEIAEQIPIEKDGSVKLPGVKRVWKLLDGIENVTLGMYLSYMVGYYGEHKRALRRGKITINIRDVVGE